MFDLAEKANNIIKDTLGMYKGREMGGGGGGSEPPTLEMGG